MPEATVEARGWKDSILDAVHRNGGNELSLIVCDLPYGVVNRASGGLRSLDKKDADLCTIDIEDYIDTVCRYSYSSYTFCSTEQISEIRGGFALKGMTTRVVVWEKSNPSPMNGQYLWLSSVELCVFARKRGAVFNEHCKSPVFRYPVARCEFHPTPKNIDMIKRIVEASSSPGDIVCDPMLGSGATAIACMETGRHFVGGDISDLYVQSVRQRMELTNA